jgi:hypothetical protein
MPFPRVCGSQRAGFDVYYCPPPVCACACQRRPAGQEVLPTRRISHRLPLLHPPEGCSGLLKGDGATAHVCGQGIECVRSNPSDSSDVCDPNHIRCVYCRHASQAAPLPLPLCSTAAAAEFLARFQHQAHQAQPQTIIYVLAMHFSERQFKTPQILLSSTVAVAISCYLRPVAPLSSPPPPAGSRITHSSRDRSIVHMIVIGAGCGRRTARALSAATPADAALRWLPQQGGAASHPPFPPLLAPRCAAAAVHCRNQHDHAVQQSGRQRGCGQGCRSDRRGTGDRRRSKPNGQGGGAESCSQPKSAQTLTLPGTASSLLRCATAHAGLSPTPLHPKALVHRQHPLTSLRGPQVLLGRTPVLEAMLLRLGCAAMRSCTDGRLACGC